MLSRRSPSLVGPVSFARILAAVSLVGSLAGCGGKLDQGTPAAQSTALRSFVGTVTEAKIVESWGPGGSLGAISVGKTARVDVRIDASGHVELVAITPFGEAVRATGTLGATTAVDVPQEGAYVSGGLSFRGTSGGWQVSETYAHFELAFDEAGLPRALTATGQASAFAGDVGTTGTATATIALAADTVAPTWHANAAASFANQALPWDARTVEASEPYEGQAAFETLFPGAARVDFDVTPFATAVAWGSPATTRERGVTVMARRWDAVAPLRARGAPVVDVAGNLAVVGDLSSGGIGVDLLAASSLPAGAAGGSPWGDAKTLSDCGDGKPCLVIGPFRQSYCGGGSAGGVAARLRGAGHASFRVRLTARSSYGGGPSGQAVAHVLATNPGAKPATDTLAFPTSASPDGTYDTGWKTISVATPNAAASETGIAVSAGGVGSAPVVADCGPAPSPAEVTVYLGEVSVAR